MALSEPLGLTGPAWGTELNSSSRGVISATLGPECLRRPIGVCADPLEGLGWPPGWTQAPSTLHRAAKFSQAEEAVLGLRAWQHCLVSLQGLAQYQSQSTWPLGL